MEGGILSDEYFMRMALTEARKAYDDNEVPVGALVVCRNQVIARGSNMTEKLHDVTAHAEILAFTSASNFLQSKFLDECTLYVTVEPCVMCAGAAYWTRIGRVVFGTHDEKRGYSLVSKKILHPKTEVKYGIMEAECATLMRDFFRNRRS